MQVKVVRGLVQQQQVWLHKECLCQGHPHAPAPGECTCGPTHHLTVKGQARQHQRSARLGTCRQRQGPGSVLGQARGQGLGQGQELTPDPGQEMQGGDEVDGTAGSQATGQGQGQGLAGAEDRSGATECESGGSWTRIWTRIQGWDGMR